MFCTRLMRLLAALVALAAVSCPTSVFADWQALSSTRQSGAGTIYGFGQNSKGACSYGTNFADTTGLPWSNAPAGASDGGTGLPTTFIALNAPQFGLTAACGSCIWFRGTGPGIGVEARRISTEWQYGFVDNICPECKKGAIDLARNFDVGDGIWTVEWHAVPCNVGSTKLHYTFTAADAYYFNLVISNTRVPVAEVAVVIQGKRVPLTRSTNNNWAYHNSQGSYTFPMEVTITPVCGAAVTDTIESKKAAYGGVQFGATGCSSLGDPTSGSGGSSSGGGGGSGPSTEAQSVKRATASRHRDTKRDVKRAASEARLLAPIPGPTPPPTAEPTAAPAGELTTDATTAKAAAVAETTAPTSPPTSEPTSAPISEPTSAPTAQPTAAPTAAPTSEPVAERTAKATSAPPAEPTPEPPPPPPTSAPTAEPTPVPTPQPELERRIVTDAPTAQPKPEPVLAPLTRTAVQTRKAKEDVMDRNLYGGTLSDATDKAVLEPWWQCGDKDGMYPGIDCGGKDWNCVWVNDFYWQCRNDAGGPSKQGRRLAAAPRRSLRH